MTVPVSALTPKAAELELDRSLVGRMVEGDRAAIALLYDRYAGTLLSLGARILRDRLEAEDVLHDVFMEAWRRARDYDPTRGTVSSWLCLRMRSRSLDRLRSKSRASVVPSEEVLRASAGTHMETDMSEAPDRRAAAEALEGLPEEQRRVLTLAYFEGLSSSEIALTLGVPIGTVKSRTAAALKKLRATFVSEGGEGHD